MLGRILPTGSRMQLTLANASTSALVCWKLINCEHAVFCHCAFCQNSYLALQKHHLLKQQKWALSKKRAGSSKFCILFLSQRYFTYETQLIITVVFLSAIRKTRLCMQHLSQHGLGLDQTFIRYLVLINNIYKNDKELFLGHLYLSTFFFTIVITSSCLQLCLP